MALIAPKKISSTEKIKLEMDRDILSDINKYCEWAGISNIEHFIEEAAKHVFLNDKDWKKHIKAS